eukprot:3582604-Amphidinium_carterae.2
MEPQACVCIGDWLPTQAALRWHPTRARWRFGFRVATFHRFVSGQPAQRVVPHTRDASTVEHLRHLRHHTGPPDSSRDHTSCHSGALGWLSRGNSSTGVWRTMLVVAA